MAITGNDTVSQQALKSIEEGHSLRYVSNKFNISIDQAKRLSRYANLLRSAQSVLSSESIHKLHELGLKSLSLYPLIKNKDWEGLTEMEEVNIHEFPH